MSLVWIGTPGMFRENPGAHLPPVISVSSFGGRWPGSIQALLTFTRVFVTHAAVRHSRERASWMHAFSRGSLGHAPTPQP